MNPEAAPAEDPRRPAPRPRHDRRATKPVAEAAADYTDRGWPVFPVHSIVDGRCTCSDPECRPGGKNERNMGKHPATKNGCKDAATDRAWNWTNRNIGIATGHAGLVVIDVDPRHGANLERKVDCWHLFDGNGELAEVLPLSLVIRTGSGGAHWYGRTAATVRNNAGNKLGTGIDVRGTGGYVVAPPSVHASGGRYSVAEDLPVAELPAELVARLAPPQRTAAVPLPSATPGHGTTSYGEPSLREECQKVANAPKGRGHHAMVTACTKFWSLVAGGFLPESAGEELVAAHQSRPSNPPLSESRRILEDMRAVGMANPRIRAERSAPPTNGTRPPKADRPDPDAEGERDAEGRRVLYLAEDKRNESLQTLADNMRGWMYLRDSMPVVLTEMDHDEITGKIDYRQGSLILRTPTPALVWNRINSRWVFMKFDKRAKDWFPTSCPKDYGAELVQAATAFGFDQVAGIIRTPLFDLDTGEIVTARGYHKPSGFIIDTIPLPPIPERPSRAECNAALDRLLRPFRGFLERGTVDQVAIAAAALTAVLRPSMQTAPCIVMNGTVPGCGKGLIARTLSAIAQGGPPTTIHEGHDQGELEKRLDTVIMAGSPVVLLDNLQRTLNSGALESGLTEARTSVRVMGKNTEMPTLTWRALVMVTANNAAMRRDMLRRILPVRIIAKTENPEADKYTFEPTAEALRDRADLLAAGFTIARGWLHAAREQAEPPPSLGSFETWARIVGGAVKWLLAKSPVELIGDQKAADPRIGAERVVMGALFEQFGKNEFRAEDAFKSPTVPWASAIPGDLSAIRASHWLGKRKDTVIGNLMLTRRLDRSGVSLWRIAEMTPS